MKKILIVEDVDFNRDLLTQLLEEEFDLIVATTAKQELPRRNRNGRTSF
jgi:CheY-like chemotaxis protein